MSEELKPCPFCGAGSSQIVENGKIWTGMKYSEPSSVSVRHWCEKIEGQPSRMLERIGKDRESAIAAWNMRAEELPKFVNFRSDEPACLACGDIATHYVSEGTDFPGPYCDACDNRHLG